ncbi:MAG: maleylpyruvate isomerase family mycothiol-dependent enzyme [Microthrixaceae bacterium]
MGTIIEIEPMRELLYADWDALDALCSGLDEHQWATPTCLPGWTVKDVLAHIAGIERMIEGDPAPTIDVSHLGHIRNDFAAAVEVWVEDQRHLSGEAVLDGFRDVVARRRAALAAMTQADFDAPSWTPVGRDETYGRFMRIRHFDIYLHELDIRDDARNRRQGRYGSDGHGSARGRQCPGLHRQPASSAGGRVGRPDRPDRTRGTHLRDRGRRRSRTPARGARP